MYPSKNRGRQKGNKTKIGCKRTKLVQLLTSDGGRCCSWKGWSSGSFTPWGAAGDRQMPHPKTPCHKSPGGRGGNLAKTRVSLNPSRQTKIYFPLLCMGDPANGVINLGSHLARLHSLPPLSSLHFGSHTIHLPGTRYIISS